MKTSNRAELDAFAMQYERRRHEGHALAQMTDDYQRHLYCLRKVEQYRDAWYAGQRRHVLAVLRSNDARFANVSGRSRVTIATLRWASTPDAQDIADDEKRWWRWQQMYITSWMATQSRQQLHETRASEE
jgi:hypothetical protein